MESYSNINEFFEVKKLKSPSVLAAITYKNNLTKSPFYLLEKKSNKFYFLPEVKTKPVAVGSIYFY